MPAPIWRVGDNAGPTQLNAVAEAWRESGSGSGWSPAALRSGSLPAAVLGLGILLWWLSVRHPALLPFWAPWDFSPPIYLTTALILFWFGRGLAPATAPALGRPPWWRRLAFLLGVALIYAVLQTRFEYWSLHMFFLNRIQHVVMHHLGPFLIALGAAGPAIRRGLPPWLSRAIGHPAIAAPIRILQRPVPAAFLFVGLIYFWLIPGVHFRAMIDPRLYAVMNWSMVLDGVLFWSLVLDSRPRPPARVSFGARIALALAVMFPQILLGAAITFSRTDLYPYYDLCGRLFPSLGALNDQHIGGVVIWIPPAMMSVVAVLVTINALRLHEEAIAPAGAKGAAPGVLASSWTGR
ncbi:MAG: cytochrome c oxidase assembly protein [Stellaceae bacterium]